MDKQTLSNYGWVIVVVLVLAVMLGLATPFGKYVGVGIGNIAKAYKEASNADAIDSNIDTMRDEWNEYFGNETAVEDGNNVVLPAKGKTLEEYTWAEVQQIIQASKATEYGFAVGGTKTLQINNATKTATIIGLNHDSNNTATFMIVSSGGIGSHVMNSTDTNAGGWKNSNMRDWLNSDIYNSMSNKDCIKEVTKMTNNIGSQGTIATSTSDKIFLLSPKEAGVEDDIVGWDWYPEEYKPVLETEGTTYTWFESNTVGGWFWLRSPTSNCDSSFFTYGNGGLDSGGAINEDTVCPAFVIG